MDINDNLQQINTFVKGMNTDVSDALMDSSQYRYAENVRLATNTDENTGELRLIEGNALYSNIDAYGTIIAMTSVRNLLIVITKKLISRAIGRDGGAEGDDYQTYRNYILVRDTKEDNGWRQVFESSIADEPFGDHISLVTRWESDNNVKLYIADGVHPLMYINITESEENSSEYVSNSGMESISGIISAFVKQPTTRVITGGGSLNAPKLQYAYRLYKLGGATTTISPLSKLVVLYESDNRGYAKYNDNLYKINRSVEVTIPRNTVDAEYLQIYRIAYVSVDEEPEVSLIYDSEYVPTYVDTGLNIATVSFAEFQSYAEYNDVPKIIESKNDYLFAANIQDTQTEIDLKYNDVDMSQYITFKGLVTKDAYVNYKNEKQWADEASNTRDQMRSLRLGEVYRYGAVLYDSEGNHTSAKWVCDIDLDTIVQDKSLYTPTKFGELYRFKVIGAQFEIDWSNLLSECPDCVAVEIVRCDRGVYDRRTITQGIAGFPLRIHDMDYDAGTISEIAAVCSPGLISANRFVVTGHMNSNQGRSLNSDWDCWANYQTRFGLSDNKVLLFSSPEYVYHKNQIRDIIDADASIKISFDGEAYTATTDGHDYEQFDVNAVGKHIKRIQGISNNYNYGVPYCVFNAPVNIVGLYMWLYAHYNSSGNGMPTYVDESGGIATYIHTAKIASYIADVSYNQEFPDFPSYANKQEAGKNNPKIFTSASAFNVNMYSSSQIQDTDARTTIVYADVPGYGDLYDDLGETFYGSEQVSVGSRGKDFVYLNWSIPISYENDSQNCRCVQGETLRVRHPDDFNSPDAIEDSNYSAFQANDGWYTYPAGSTGECIAIELQNSKDFYQYSNNQRASNEIGLYIVSLKHDVTPYGGSDEYSKKNSKYVSFGNVILATDPGSRNYQIYDGDCYPGVFVYNACHGYFEGGLGGGVTQSNVQMVPLYSDVDLSATYGDLFPSMDTNTCKQWFQDTPCIIEAKNGLYTQSMEAYRYDSAYSTDPTAMTYMAMNYTKLDSENFDVRVKYSNPKTNNEHIDSWLKFSPNNFRDVDTRFGKITNMRLFKDKLLFWQEHAVGVLSVNDRTILNDVDNHDIIVGTGDVLARHDYISTIYGMKEDQYEAEVQSNTTQYWWDGYNKEILAYGGGMELVPLTKMKGVTNYINGQEESSHPALIYDNKYDEVVAQVIGEESLVYSEQIQAFSSIYTFMPLYRTNIDNALYIASSQQIYIQNQQDTEAFSELFGYPAFPKVRIVVNKNNIYNKTFDNLTFGGRLYSGSTIAMTNWPMQHGNGMYVTGEHLNSPMVHLMFTFETPLKQRSSTRGDKAISVDEYDYRLAIPRNGLRITEQTVDSEGTVTNIRSDIQYGNRMRGKTMQCEIASDYNSTDFSLQYITTKFRMSWS